MNITPLALLTTLSLSSALATCQPGPHSYDNPAGRLDSSLQTLAHQTGCFIQWDGNAPGRTISAIKGTYTPIEALWQTLKGTGLEGHETSGGLAVNRDNQLQVLTQVFATKQQVKWAVQDGVITRNGGLLFTHQLDRIGESVQEVVRTQGFVSAAENASYFRTIQEVQNIIKNK